MGQQQLLLVVLGVIIVGIAIVVGINMFIASTEQANRDMVISDLMNISSMARAHYARPAEMGGGGNSFAGFEIPASLLQNENGTYEIYRPEHGPYHIHFLGTGIETGEDGSDPISIEVRLTLDIIKVTMLN